MYVRTLPAEARLARRDGDEAEWGTRTELAAQTLEVLSVMASGRQLRKPIEVTRPASLKPAGKQRGLAAAVAAAQAAGRVRTGG